MNKKKAGKTFQELLNNDAFNLNMHSILANQQGIIEELEKQLKQPADAFDEAQALIEVTLRIVPLVLSQIKVKRLNAIYLSYISTEERVIIEYVDKKKIRALPYGEVKPDELHYEFDAKVADFNIKYQNDHNKIEDTFQSIVDELKRINWKPLCKVSDQLTIQLKN